MGAVNCTALAATINDPKAGMQLLSDVWLNQQLSDVLSFNMRQATRLYRVWLGGGVQTVENVEVDRVLTITEE